MFHTDSRYKRDEADKKVDFIVRFLFAHRASVSFFIVIVILVIVILFIATARIRQLSANVRNLCFLMSCHFISSLFYRSLNKCLSFCPRQSLEPAPWFSCERSSIQGNVV